MTWGPLGVPWLLQTLCRALQRVCKPKKSVSTGRKFAPRFQRCEALRPAKSAKLWVLWWSFPDFNHFRPSGLISGRWFFHVHQSFCTNPPKLRIEQVKSCCKWVVNPWSILGGVLYPMSFSGQLEWLGAGSSGIKRQLCQQHVGHIVNPYDADFYRLARSWCSMCKSCFSVLYTGKAFARIYCYEFCQWLRDSEPPSQHRSIFGWDCLPQIGLKSKSWCQTVSSSNSVKLRFASPAGFFLWKHQLHSSSMPGIWIILIP